MSSAEVSEEEKLSLRNKAKTELERLELLLTDESTVELLNDFKNKFNICETIYKVILAEHQRHKGKSNNNFLKVDMRQVPYALDFAGYSFEKELLKELFGSSSEKGLTIKKLRDNVTHGIKEKAIIEISERKDELFGYMNAFLEQIRTFDDVVA